MIKYDLIGYNQKIDLNTLNNPLYIYIELTDACNLNCKFCSVNKKCNNFMTFELFKQIINNLKKLNIFDVYYTGGEPLLHPEFKKFVEYAFNLGIRQTVLTNGLLIDKYTDILDRILCVCVSLHGTEKTHNLLTGKDCYKKVLENLNIVKQYTNVKVNYTVVWENQSIEQMIHVLNLCRDKSIEVSFSKYNNIGIGKVNKCAIDIDCFVENLDILNNMNFDFTVNDCIAPCLVKDKYLYLTHGCGAGYLFASITYDGNVKICPSSNMILGNLNQKDFRNIWNQKKLKQFRNFKWIPLYCKSCKHLSRCKCGCKIELNNEITEFNDYHVSIKKDSIWDKINKKKLLLNISLLRKEDNNYISLSNPPRKFNQEAIKVIRKINDGYIPSEIDNSKEIILSMYRDKILLEENENVKKKIERK